MTTAYQHRPLSKILAPVADQKDARESQTSRKEADDEPKNELPEKYRGKTIEEIVEMHRNSESRLGQLQNEVGQLRGLVSDMAQVQRPTASPTEDKEALDVSGDDLISDPVETIRRVIQPELDNLKKESSEKEAKNAIAQAASKLQMDFPDMNAIAADPEFQKWAIRTSSRERDLQIAAQGEGIEAIEAARRLLEDWKDFKSLTSASDDSEGVEKAKQVANANPTGTVKVSSDELVYETDVLEVLRTDPARYRSPSYQKELLRAIKEGRYVKQG